MPVNPMPELSAREAELVYAIARRAVACNVPGPTLHVAMDVAAVHVFGRSPLRLEELRDAPIDYLVHDVEGIRRHLDRETGELDKRDPEGDPRGFVPRYAGGERVR